MTELRAISTDIRWHAGLPIYASEPFLKAVGDEYGWIGGVDGSGRLRCILPYTVIRKPGFRIVRFRVETVPLGEQLSELEEKSFLNSTVEYFRADGADLIIPGTNAAVFQTYPDGAVAAPYGTFIKDLTQSEETLLKEVHETYRYNIRRAIKGGAAVTCGMEHLQTAYELISWTLKRSGVAFKKYDEFERMILGLKDHVKIFTVSHDGVPQGCMVAPYSQRTAYTWYCGSRLEPLLGSMHLLHWEAMRQFRAMGVQNFDFQGVRISPEKGSKQDGIFNFKRRFGGKHVEGYVWKYSLRPIKWVVYSAAVRLLKGGDIVDNERHKLLAPV